MTILYIKNYILIRESLNNNNNYCLFIEGRYRTTGFSNKFLKNVFVTEKNSTA